MWIPILFLKKWSFILVTHSCWLLDMFDNLLWWPSVYFMNLVRIINHLLNHLIKPCNKIVAVNRITGENVVPTSGAACCLNNLIIIATISGWFLSGRYPYSTASLPMVFDLPQANDLDFFSSDTTLTYDLYLQHLPWGVLAFDHYYLHLCCTLSSYILDSTSSASLLKQFNVNNLHTL